MSEIIQAQNLRLSRPPQDQLDQLVPQEPAGLSNMQHHLEEPSGLGASAETPRTRRKMATSTKRIQFETSYAKALPMVDRIGKNYYVGRSEKCLALFGISENAVWILEVLSRHEM